MRRVVRFGLAACLVAGASVSAVAQAPVMVASPAPSGARFTPAMTWDGIKALPRLDGVSWASTKAWDMSVVRVQAITLAPPLKPEWMAVADAFVARAKAGKAEFKAGACYPNGVPRSIWYAYPPSFTYKPGNSLLVTSMGETREVWMDGRAHPASFDPKDTAIAYLGHSVGWWEGDTLVIDTVGFAPDHEIYYDVPNGGGMHVVERYRLIDATTLQLDFTLEDAERLAKPWVLSRRYGTAATADSTMGGRPLNRIETFTCRPADSRESIDASGNGFVDLTPPPPGTGLGKKP